MLSSWNVGFEPVDVEADPAAGAELARLGIPLVPAVVLGDRWVHGWNPKALAALVGVPHVEREPLPPRELLRRLERILVAAQRAIRQVPPAHLDMKAPDRDRTVRSLGYHIFRLIAGFPDGVRGGRFPEAWLLEEPPSSADGTALARYGESVQQQLGEWALRDGWCEGVVETYYGPQTAHELLERTTWHAAQHLRQLYAFLARMAVSPEDSLGEADFDGLPIPKEVWS